MSYSALDIAKYIINKCTAEKHPISNLQLQKILYYIQKEFIDSDCEAFTEEIEAWQFGPVVRNVYNNYCGFGGMPITMNYDIDICNNFIQIIDPIVIKKRELDPWKMVEDTHKPEKAWCEIYNDGKGAYDIIPKMLIKEKG